MAARKCSTASRARRANTTTKTSSVWLTTWSDGRVRHHALAKRVKSDAYLVNVFTPCHGHVPEALDNTGTEMAPTCLFCVASRFVDNVKAMNLGGIRKLSEYDLLDHFVDRGAMSLSYDHGA